MPKRSKPINRKKLVGDVYKAVQAYVEGYGGKLWIVGLMTIDVHKPTSFDLVIECVGERPKTPPEEPSPP